MCENSDFFIALSSAAYERFKGAVPASGLILFNPAFVENIDDSLAYKQIDLPAKQLAVDNFNKAIFSNTIALETMARLLDENIEKDVI